MGKASQPRAAGAPHWLGMAWPQAILPALATRALVAALAHAGRLATTILLILFAPFARRWYRRCARAARADASAAGLGAPRGARTPPAWLLSFVPCEPPSGSLGASLERSPLLLGSSGGSGTASGTASGSFSYGTRWDLDGVLAEGGEELGREDDLQLDALLASLACSDHSVLHEAVVACRRALGSTENAAEPPLQIERVLHAIEAGVLRVLGALGPGLILIVKNDEANMRKARDACASAFTAGLTGQTVPLLLASEVREGMHETATRGGEAGGALLRDPSAAIALLWMRRSLGFTVALIDHLTDESSSSPPNMVEALGCAYASQLEQYHGWLIRKTFGIVSAQAPDYPTVLRLLSPGLAEDERESVVRTEMKAFVKTGGLLVRELEKVFEDLGLEDLRKV